MSDIASTIVNAVTSAEKTQAHIEASTAPVTAPPIPEAGMGTILGGVAALIAAFASIAPIIRRRLSRDNVEVTKDRVEGQLLDSIAKERDAAVARADSMQAQSLVNAATIATLTERNKYLQEEIIRVNAAFKKLEAEFERLKTYLQRVSTAAQIPLPTEEVTQPNQIVDVDAHPPQPGDTP